MDEYAHPTRPIDLTWVDKNVRAFARHWWNLLYLRTGLEKLFLLISELDVLCDGPWFSHAYVDVHKKLLQLNKDDKTRIKALVAVSLSEMLPAGNETKKATQTYMLFESLLHGGERATAITQKFVSDLEDLRESKSYQQTIKS